jgi:hypothetical protein
MARVRLPSTIDGTEYVALVLGDVTDGKDVLTRLVIRSA